MRNLWKLCAAAVAATAGTAAMAQPANDDCATPAVAMLGSTQGTNVNATASFGVTCQTSAQQDVFYTFTPPAAGDYLLTTETLSGSLSDTVLSVHVDCTGTEIACDDDDGSVLKSSLIFTAPDTTPVLVRVAGHNNQQGTFTLNINTLSTANDECAGAQTISGTLIAAAADLVNGTTGSDAAPSCDATPGVSVWYSFMPPSNGFLTLSEFSDSMDAVFTAYTGACGALVEHSCNSTDTGTGFAVTGGTTYFIRVANQGTTVPILPVQVFFDYSTAPANDNCGTAAMISSSSTPIVIDARAADADVPALCDTGRFTVWYTFTPTENTKLFFSETNTSVDTTHAVYSGGCGGLTPVGTCQTAETSSSILLTGGTQYWLQVGYDPTTGTPSGAYNFTAEFPVTPANDDCASPVTVSTPMTHVADARIATVTEGIAIAGTCDTTTGFSVWYTYTATASGALRINETSSADVVLSAYTGTCGVLSSSLLCSSADDAILQVTNGETYLIRIANNSDTTGPTVPYSTSFSFIASPDNDDCANAAPITVPSSVTVSAQAASNPEGAAAAGTCDTTTGFSVWYSFTPAVNGALNVNETSSADVVVSAYTGACGATTVVDCNSLDNDTIAMMGGTPYLIRVAGASDTIAPTVDFAISFSYLEVPANDLCADAVALTSLPTTLVADARLATHAGDPSHGTCDTTTGFSVWYSYMATADGSLRVEDTSSATVRISAFTGDCMTPVNATPSYSCSTSDTVLLPVTSGTTYLIRVANTSDTTAPSVAYNLNFDFVPAPANDTCATATTVSSFPFSQSVDARGAGLDNTVACDSTSITGGGSSRFGVWYTFTPTENGSLTVNEASSLDSVVALFTGSCGMLGGEVCIDGGSGTGESAAFAVVSGTQYWILVTTFSPTAFPTVNYEVNMSFVANTGACCNGASCTIVTFSACTGGMGTYLGDNAVCAPPAGMPQNFGPGSGFAIPDVSSGSSSIVIAGPSFNIGALSVILDVNHTWVSDVVITLSNGTVTQILYPGTSSHSDDLTGVFTLSDAGTQTLDDAAAAATGDIPDGTYRASEGSNVPVSLNTVFGNQPSEGTWTLTFADDASGISGTVNSWTLVLDAQGTPACMDEEPTDCEIADFDGSGTVDATDIFIFLDAWFAQNGMTAPGLSADVDGSGTVDATDIFIYLDFWFAQNGMTC